MVDAVERVETATPRHAHKHLPRRWNPMPMALSSRLLMRPALAAAVPLSNVLVAGTAVLLIWEGAVVQPGLPAALRAVRPLRREVGFQRQGQQWPRVLLLQAGDLY